MEDNEQITQRRAKLSELRSRGNPFVNDFRRNAFADDLRRDYGDLDNEGLETAGVRVAVAGRLMTRRIMGKASFAHVKDATGAIQLYVRRDDLPEGFYNQEFKKWDIGDIVGAEGVLFKTKTKELSIKVDNLRLLTKSLRPLPEKFHGLEDQETRYRRRYVDLAVNDDTRRVFRIRARMIDYMRDFFVNRRFLEVETPMMQVIPGGAVARPFVTHHNALDMPLYLRIAPELFLKRLVVGGFERVFEINRNFRNEGLSTRHNPEFTMLEFYQAYSDYVDLMDLTETLMRGMAEQVLDSTVISYDGEHFDLGAPFQRLTVKESIQTYNPDLAGVNLDDPTVLRGIAESLRIAVKSQWGTGKIQIEIFEKTVEANLKQPTFITAYPTEVSPLARRNDEDPSVTDRFEFFVGGRELANGFSELNDPDDQAGRFRAQVAEREAGDAEAMYFDQDYIEALEYGLPPTAGEGIGVDRLVMLFTDSASIRDVLLFPHMRQKER